MIAKTQIPRTKTAKNCKIRRWRRL